MAQSRWRNGPVRVLAANLLPAPPDPEPSEPTESELLRAAIMSNGYAGPRILQFLRAAGELGYDTDDPDVMHRAILAGNREIERESKPLPPPPLPVAEGPWSARSPLVYYMRMSDMVKIGTTTNIAGRLDAIMPQELMTAEPGGRDVEQHRHKEFSQAHSHGEWFYLDDPVMAHIEQVQAVFAERVGEPFNLWLQRVAPKQFDRTERATPRQALPRHWT